LALWSRTRRIIGSSSFSVGINGWDLVASIQLFLVISGACTSPGNFESSFFFVILVVGWSIRLGGTLAKESFHCPNNFQVSSFAIWVVAPCLSCRYNERIANNKKCKK
jgi:hypothetical protein